MPRITPTTEVKIYCFDDVARPIKLITLAAWRSALKAELRGAQVSSQRVEPLAREFLRTPDDYPLEWIVEHVETSLADIDHQFETGEFNLT